MLPRRSPSLDCIRQSFFFVSIGTKKIDTQKGKLIYVYNQHDQKSTNTNDTTKQLHTTQLVASAHTHNTRLLVFVNTTTHAYYSVGTWRQHKVNGKLYFCSLFFSVSRCLCLSLASYGISSSLSHVPRIYHSTISSCCCCCRSPFSMIVRCRCYRW